MMGGGRQGGVHRGSRRHDDSLSRTRTHLVEEQHGGVAEEGARDGDALLLPARQKAASCANVCRIAELQPIDEVRSVGIGSSAARRAPMGGLQRAP